MADKQQPLRAVYLSEVSFSIARGKWSFIAGLFWMKPSMWIMWSRRDSSFFFLYCQGAKETIKKEDTQICVAYGFLPLPEQLHAEELSCSFTWFLIKLSASFHWNITKPKLAGGNKLGCLVHAILVLGFSQVFQWLFWLERQTGGPKETKAHHLPFRCLCFFYIVIKHSTGLEPRVGDWDFGLNS